MGSEENVSYRRLFFNKWKKIHTYKPNMKHFITSINRDLKILLYVTR